MTSIKSLIILIQWFSLLFCAIFLWMSCESTKDVPAKSLTNDNVTQEALQFVVGGSLTYNSNYCGGAAPSQEMVDSYRKKRPFAERELLLIDTNKNNPALSPLDTIKTDKSGHYQLSLPVGHYGLVRDRRFYLDKYQKEKFSKSDWQCLQKWINQPDLTFVITQQNLNLDTTNLFIPCAYRNIPCRSFWGDPPR